VARLTRDEIVAQLEGHGRRFRTVTHQTEGDYLPGDVDWNNKDLLHLNEVHERLNDVTFVLEEDHRASISLQRVLGIPFPLVMVHYDDGPDEQTHVVTMLAWTIVTHHRFVRVTPTRTRAITSYSVGASRFWMAFFPLIRLAIRRNWEQLMAEDIPMRERRGLLRSWGYSFRGDDRSSRDFRTTVVLEADNVVPPADPGPAPDFDPVPLSTIIAGRWTLLGRSDHLGLRLTREGNTVVAYGRLCPHEGAELDEVPVVDACVSCPWHGRRLDALAVLDLGDPAPKAETAWHRLEVVDDRVRVTVTVPDHAT
jgi:nitrite reductase/ring-hydroxylating ferredoxin subunit